MELGSLQSTCDAIFTNPTNYRLKYAGFGNIKAHIAVSMSFSSSTNNSTYYLALEINGVVQTKSQFRRDFANASTFLPLAFHDVQTLTTGDEISIGISCTSGAGTTITIQNANIQCMCVGC